MNNYKEGDVVSYRGSCYWVYELRGNRIKLLPMEAVSFEDGVIYDLGQTLEVDKSKIEPYSVG